MTYNFFDLLQLVGSLGIFIYGMKIFSDGLQKVAGARLRSILKGMTTTRLRGILTGFGITTITQSSSATTVMLVSFVNAGLITFLESTGVVMGANIGTTVTAWMVSIFGFKMKITPVAIALIGIFFPFLFVKREKLRSLAEAMLGFGILFIGLQFIKDSVPDIRENPEMFQFLDQFTEFGFLSILLFVLAGTLLTLVTQSSSASTAITLVMLFEGWISFPIAAAMILGENIGTTVTANIAAVIGNVHAKRAARFHFMFNVIGVAWMLLLLTPFLHGIDAIIQNFIPGSGSVLTDLDNNRDNATLALSLFHTTFNVINVIVLFAFVPAIVRMIERLQKEKADSESQFRLQYIASGVISSEELSLSQAAKEIEVFGMLIEKMHFSFEGLFRKKRKKEQKFLDKIEKREQITDRIELEIAEYLTHVSGSLKLTEFGSRRVRSMHSMINDLERIADIYYQMSRTFYTMRQQEIVLPDQSRQDVYDMMDFVLRAIKNMRVMLSRDGIAVETDLVHAIELEDSINGYRDVSIDKHYERLESGFYSSKEGFVYLDLINRLEKVGDHVFNVCEASVGRKVKAAYKRVVEPN